MKKAKIAQITCINGHEKRINILFSPQSVTELVYKKIVINPINPEACDIYFMLNITNGNQIIDIIISKTRLEYLVLVMKQKSKKIKTENSK
jgi:hypothetical protein